MPKSLDLHLNGWGVCAMAESGDTAEAQAKEQM